MAGNGGNVDSFSILNQFECVKIVEKAFNNSENDFDLIEFKLNSISKNVLGFCGDYYNLIITLKRRTSKDIEKLECFVKTLPQNNAVQRNSIADSGAFKRERSLHCSLFDKMDQYNKSQKWHGGCYYARDDILVCEDLTKAGFRHKPTNEVFSQDYLEITLKCAARMHANSIAFENSTGINILTKYEDVLLEHKIDADDALFRIDWEILNMFVEMLPACRNVELTENFSVLLQKYFRILLDYHITSETFRNVLCHTDLWDRNILFKYDIKNPLKPIDCIFVDFADSQYCPPAFEILLIINTCTTKETRKESIKEILAYYYNCLLEEGHKMNVNVEKQIPFLDFMKSCDYCKPMVIYLAVEVLPWLLLPEPIYDLMKSDPEKFNKVTYDTSARKEFILGLMEEDEDYKKVIFDVVEDLVDYLQMNLQLE